MGIALDPEFAEGEPYAYMMATVGDDQPAAALGVGRRPPRARRRARSTTSPARPTTTAARCASVRTATSTCPRATPARRSAPRTGPRSRARSCGLTPEEYRGDDPVDDPTMYSIGHRNPQGLSWQPGSGRLFASEHGAERLGRPRRRRRGQRRARGPQLRLAARCRARRAAPGSPARSGCGRTPSRRRAPSFVVPRGLRPGPATCSSRRCAGAPLRQARRRRRADHRRGEARRGLRPHPRGRRGARRRRSG